MWNIRNFSDNKINYSDRKSLASLAGKWGNDPSFLYFHYDFFNNICAEHKTFRSNHICEGDLNRDNALILVKSENRLRYPNIKWYLVTGNMDFRKVAKIIIPIPKIEP